MAQHSTKPETPLNSARVRVDLRALAGNYRKLRDRTAGACAGVVKANGYGLGVEVVAETLAATGCSVFCVATLAEALQLQTFFATAATRPANSISPMPRIVLLGGVNSAAAAEAAAAAGIEPVLNSVEQAEHWWPWRGRPATLHIDTGMERLGVLPDELGSIDWSAYRLAMLMTHLACADTPEHPLNELQLERFATALKQLPALPTSIANSAGCLLPRRWHGDLSRPGIGLYGGHPQNRVAGNPLQAVVHMEGQIVQRRAIPSGTSIGYGASYVAQRPTEIAVVGLGYADGLPRVLSNVGEVGIAGQRAPIVGRVSMDVVHVDVTDLNLPPLVGDWVEFMGADISVDEVAQWAETIGLEVLCGLGQRPQWEYVGAP